MLVDPRKKSCGGHALGCKCQGLSASIHRAPILVKLAPVRSGRYTFGMNLIEQLRAKIELDQFELSQIITVYQPDLNLWIEYRTRRC